MARCRRMPYDCMSIRVHWDCISTNLDQLKKRQWVDILILGRSFATRSLCLICYIPRCNHSTELSHFSCCKLSDYSRLVLASKSLMITEAHTSLYIWYRLTPLFVPNGTCCRYVKSLIQYYICMFL